MAAQAHPHTEKNKYLVKGEHDLISNSCLRSMENLASIWYFCLHTDI